MPPPLLRPDNLGVGQTATKEGLARAPARAEARARAAQARTVGDGVGAFAGDLLALQGRAGNAAVNRWLHVGLPGGSGEHQAEAVADAAVTGRRPATRPWLAIGPTALREIPASVADVLASEAGRPLDGVLRAQMEMHLGGGLEVVRVHTGAGAAASARELGARAYTVGTHVVFGPGRFAPETTAGRRLLAHELAHVVQQGGRPRALQMAPETGTPETPPGPAPRFSSSPAQRALESALLSSMLATTGLPPGGSRLVVAVGHGMGEEIANQLTTGGKGVALVARLSAFRPGDVNEFGKGFGLGLTEGIVSPVTDLFSLAVLGEKIQNWVRSVLSNPLAARTGLGADVDALLQSIGKLGAEQLKAWEQLKKKPLDLVIFILKLPEVIEELAEQKAYELGKKGGDELVQGILSPFGLAKPEQPAEQPNPFTSPLAFIESKAKQAESWFLDSPWSKIGAKIGWAIGFVAIQVILFAFTTGIGNALEQVGVGLAKIGSVLEKFSARLGAAAAKIAEAVVEFGQAISFVEQWIGRIIARLLKPAEKLLEPVMRALGEVQERLKAFLLKLFGFAQKESAELGEAAAARAARALEGSVERGPKGAPRTAAPEPKPPPEPVTAAEPKPKPTAEPPPREGPRLPIDPELGEGVLASRKIDGHTYKVTESGRIFRCTHCDEILALLDAYKAVFAKNRDLLDRLEQVEQLAEQARNAKALGDPAAKKLADDAAEQASDLYRDVRRSAGAERELATEGPLVAPKRPGVPPVPPDQVDEGLASLARRRAQNGLPVAGAPDDGYTLSRLDVGDQSFRGQNAHGQPIDLVVNAQSATHAEAESFQGAAHSLEASRQTRGILYVDRELCRSCGDFGAVESLARQLGLLQLDIYTPAGLQTLLLD